jgi:hypothetical protein
MRSRLHHPPRPATGAKTSSLATARHQVFVAAAVALDAQEPVFQQAALQIVFELLADELGKMAASTFDLVHETRVIFSNNGIERAMPVVGRRNRDRGRSRHWT